MTTPASSLNEELRCLIGENLLFAPEDGRFGDDDCFMELGIIDSTGVLDLVKVLEEQYQIAIDDDDLIPENLDSINNLIRFIGAKRPRAMVDRTA